MLIEQIPEMTAEKEDAARRFINLVDEFYDRRVKLITTAALAPEARAEEQQADLSCLAHDDMMAEISTLERCVPAAAPRTRCIFAFR